MSKKDIAAELVRRSPGLFACPACGEELLVNDSYAFVCANRHSFDIASSGYVNLLTAQVKPDYGSAMLEARGRICRAGFYDCLLQKLTGILSARLPSSGAALLDAGCGEGSHLVRLSAMLCSFYGGRFTGIGVDISKDGIRIAAREYPGCLWCVADLAKLPLAANSTDAVVNILSPANYKEFNRVLKDGGVLVKAVPGSGYLRELRQTLYHDDRREYSGERVREHFAEHFRVQEERHVLYTVSVEGEGLQNLLEMTPLSWSAEEKDKITVLDKGKLDVTLEFNVMIGIKRQDGRL